MAIAYDNSIEDHNFDVSTRSFSYTTAGVERALVAIVLIDEARSVSSITYGGTSLGTAVFNVGNAGANWRLLGYVLAAPASGANTFALTTDASSGNFSIMLSSYTGVHQTTPNRTGSTNGGTSTAASVTVSNAEANDYIVDGVVAPGATTLTKDASQTLLFTESVPAMGSSYKSASGSTSMDWTLGASGAWGIGAVPLRPTELNPAQRSVSQSMAQTFQQIITGFAR